MSAAEAYNDALAHAKLLALEVLIRCAKSDNPRESRLAAAQILRAAPIKPAPARHPADAPAHASPIAPAPSSPPVTRCLDASSLDPFFLSPSSPPLSPNHPVNSRDSPTTRLQAAAGLANPASFARPPSRPPLPAPS